MDLESRTHRKRSVGRWKKHIGDLALQAGMTAEALEQYQAAADLLRPVNDWLWLAGCFEGLCAASITLLYPHLRRPVAIQRIGSLSGEGLSSRNRYIQVFTTNLMLNLISVDLLLLILYVDT